MAVRIYPAPHKHPLDCEVCEGRKKVTVRTVVPIGVGLLPRHGLRRWLPTRLALVIDCPQCTGAEELTANLPRRPGEGGGPRATA
jgi:hypothetical protein